MRLGLSLTMVVDLTSSSASRAANCVKIWLSGLRQTLANTFKRPRWGIPMTMDSTPSSVDLSITCFMAGMRISQPSRPNRFSLDHFRARKASNLKCKQKGKKKHEYSINTSHASFQRLLALDSSLLLIFTTQTIFPELQKMEC